MHDPIAITAIASVSALGNSQESVWQNYLKPRHLFTKKQFGHYEAFAAFLDEPSKNDILALRNLNHKYRFLDNSVVFAMVAARKAVESAGWNGSMDFGINLGSSRGATSLFEGYHQEFIETGMVPVASSPTTTLGNISSWVAHDLQSDGPEISHSITCSTGLHAILNGVAWLRAGMADRFLVGGSEAPLTNFTLAQMHALKIYARGNSEYPCRAFDLAKDQNSMVLGEAAAVCCLEMGIKDNALAYITGIGYATELLEHSVSISAEANCFQKSMRMALGKTAPEEIDAIVMHAPGTIKGDLSEVNAIAKVFGSKKPLLTTNKWQVGHSFAASGMLNMELALLMMKHQMFIGVPFAEAQTTKCQFRNILINSVGFGGNAVSILLTKA